MLAPIWQSVPGTLVLYGALITHALLGLYALWGARRCGCRCGSLRQLVFGLAVPLLLMPHVFGTRIADWIARDHPTYHRSSRHLGEARSRWSGSRCSS